VVLVAVLGVAQVPGEVKAKQLTVVDQAGAPALQLSVDPEGTRRSFRSGRPAR
jgi:hypothetical protein